jgi:hypothetical protein
MAGFVRPIPDFDQIRNSPIILIQQLRTFVYQKKQIMTARIRRNEKKGIFLLVLFTALLLYFFLTDEDTLPKQVTLVFDSLQTQLDADLPSTSSNCVDSLSLYTRMRSARATWWLCIQHHILTTLF